ncbi:cytochrome c oxidase assembly protein [Mycolicibacterium sp. P9-64]|nr:cytochrome c oxidase assembly protein [Mycolicibacterium sp. P9-64]
MARRGGEPTPAQAWSFASGLVLWALATLSVIAVYAPVLFWMRALQVLMLLFAVPFLLALGRPVATLRAASSPSGRARLDRVLASRPARVVCSPLVTSALMLATPWLLYLTPWYVASLVNSTIGALTRILLLLIGFGYFYARLQADPVPHRYSPLLSMGISVAETLGDGLLGLVLWLGPLIAEDYYAGLGRTWGPSMRTDQTVGAGILWILGDVLGLPFLLLLMRALGSREKELADEADEADEVDRTVHVEPGSVRPTLWWEADPQLRNRFGRG